ncbi:hypothetical protein PGTUg99_019188 [Puccinia graminis f. sp. tritici]|uniref:Uncharacterized protein n=1 Tax=Puccinia graminis f. sp. tritici TaxID=56615 RepID=A0A5B0LI65_PUCGR|nr:hypothetical protein PGTUg99_019188 [Puccinia graminis f. sp. tritici]
MYNRAPTTSHNEDNDNGLFNRSTINGEQQTSKRKRVRPGKNVKRWELKKKTALQPFQATSTDPSQEQEDEKGISSTHSATQSNNNNTNNNQKEKIFVYLVPPSHQFDPKPSEAITTQQTLQLYQHFTHGTCVAGALINARLPPPRTPTPTPLQKGRAIEPAPQGGAGLIARPSESCFRGKTGFRGAGRQTRPS